jgi:hypothetical protein
MVDAMLSLKMVSVADGEAQWFYRHSASTDTAAEKETVDYYYLSEGTKKTKKKKLVWGLLAASLGVSAAVVGARVNENGTSFAQRNMGFGLAWASVLPLTIGIAMTTAGLVAQAKPPIYQSPDEVLCARPPFFENPFVSQPVPADEKGESPVLHSTLIDGIADHFFETVRTLSLDIAVQPPAPAPSPAEATVLPSAKEGQSVVITEKGGSGE